MCHGERLPSLTAASSLLLDVEMRKCAEVGTVESCITGAAMVAHWHSLLQPECDVVVEAQARLASDRATGTPHTLEHHIMLPE